MSDRRRNLFVLLAVIGLMAASAVVVLQKDTKLGLDLQGGVSLIYQGKPTKQQPVINAEAMQRAVDIIRDRVDALGVAEPEVAVSGDDQIEVSLPAVRNAQRAADQVGTTAQMAFYDWEPNVLDQDCKPNPDEVNGGQAVIVGLKRAVERASKCPAAPDANNTNASANRFYGFTKAGQAINSGQPEATEAELFDEEVERPDKKVGKQPGDEVLEVPEGILVVRGEQDEDATKKTDTWWVIKDNPVLAGTDIKNPEQNFDQTSNEPIVTMEFTDRGKTAFAETTAEIAARGSDNAIGRADPPSTSHHFAIVLDNELISRPYIDWDRNPDGIDGETGAEISGGFTIQSAQDLAKFLKIGALPIDLELISRSQVSATLGKQALNQGLTAGIAGFAIVAMFLLIFYRVAGMIAVLALAIYALYFYALVKLIPITMTLPGIAGLILTLGVAADANIVIFERVKEEIRKGRSVAAGIAEGYKKGFSTIVDANVVTLLVAFILFILATAGVKGFAFTLGVGVIISLFTAVLATQALLLSLRGTRVISSRGALGATEVKHQRRFDFMGASRWFFSMSGVILMIGALAIAGKGLDLGIDFESGTRIKAPLSKSVDVEEVRSTLAGLGYPSAKIQTVNDPDIGRNVVQISTEALKPPDVDKVEQALEAKFGLADEPSSDSIGPTFGASVANSALVAIIASLTVIGAYIALRFEWKYAVPVLIALMHDILITAGVYALVDREVTTSTVAALLTILGFSLYDTIIVFDRIRENVPRMPSAAFSQIVNRSMSEVIVRSLATSFCTVLPVLGLWLFGGDTLKDFAFALIIGTLSGTYSSVFIASPVLAHWKSREPIYKAREARITAEIGHVPAYADAASDVGPTDRRTAPSRLTAPSDPSQGVSKEEFDELVANLGVETKPVVAPPRQRPAGGRRARGNGVQAAPKPKPPASQPKPADPDSGRTEPGPGDGTGKKKPRNKKHGRAR